MSSLPTFADVQAAARRLEEITIRTPLLDNERVNRMLGGRLFLKAECLQRTGSFKLRGAYNFLASMSEADRARGVVGWSSGNHAQGLAEAARLLGTRATIVMPADAPALKVANTRASGAEVVLYDRVRDSREEIGQGIAAERRKGVDRQHRVWHRCARGDGPGAVQLDAVPLAIIETQRLDLASAEPVQRPIQTGGGILPAGQDDQGTAHGNAACPLASRTLGLMAMPPRGAKSPRTSSHSGCS